MPIITDACKDGNVTYYGITPGLTKLEYAAIHILAGYRAGERAKYVADEETIAAFAVADARALFAELAEVTE